MSGERMGCEERAGGAVEAVGTRCEVIRVEASRGYDVVVGAGLLAEAGRRVRQAVPTSDDTCLVVSDEHVAPLYGRAVRESLANAGFDVHDVTLPAGEQTKSLESYGVLLQELARVRATRSSMVVALGGGVIGDLAGFAAATYMRGCHLVQLATSLLSMVDSSVGGKTAVDLPQGKNLAGAFYQPDLVLCDLDALRTLPDEYASDGMGEVVKYAVMADPELFSWLQAPDVGGCLARVVARCVRIKRDVVQADEREAGERKKLNLGHTVGHAIELLSGYRTPHGHAVAAGMAIMARACAARGLCAEEVPGLIEDVLRAHGLPTGCDYAPDELLAAARADKKRVGDAIDVVLVRGIGRTEVRRLGLGELGALVADGVAPRGDVAGGASS